jgi:hypothetical protein
MLGCDRSLGRGGQEALADSGSESVVCLVGWCIRVAGAGAVALLHGSVGTMVRDGVPQDRLGKGRNRVTKRVTT